MKTYYEWSIKEIRLKSRKKIICEFKYEAMQKIIEEILAGRFIIELNKKVTNNGE